jgi:cell division protein FtsQ
VGEKNLFLKPETVNKLLIEKNREVKTISKVKLDLNQLEKNLNSYKLIEKSQVSVSIDGVLKAVVQQKVPLVRFFTQKGSYYIDYKGNKMPLSENFTARVPLVTGAFQVKNNEKLIELFRLIYNDNFLKKNIIGIQLMSNGSIKMINRNYDYQINFGETKRMNAKFNNYKVFYQKAAADSLLNNYKTIDLRFSKQVVCTKK